MTNGGKSNGQAGHKYRGNRNASHGRGAGVTLDTLLSSDWSALALTPALSPNMQLVKVLATVDPQSQQEDKVRFLYDASPNVSESCPGVRNKSRGNRNESHDREAV